MKVKDEQEGIESNIIGQHEEYVVNDHETRLTELYKQHSLKILNRFFFISRK